MIRSLISRLSDFSLLISTIAVLTVPTAVQAGKIEARLLFSTDGGVTYTDKQPVIAASKKLQVKTEWRIVGEDRPIKDGVVLTSLRSEQCDFGSANVGNKNWSGVPAWYQRIETSWLSSKSTEPVIYPLDLGARPAGVIGSKNVWNPGESIYEDGPLTATPALAPGVHKFVMRLHYTIPDASEPVVADLPFEVTITP